MGDVYILDKNLEVVALIDSYQSLIWANRYWDNGDCEIYLSAAPEVLAAAQLGYYLKRPDDDMICRIVKIELATDAENGNYITITGTDAKSLIDQRIVWSTTTAQGNAEDFARKLVYDSLIVPLERGRIVYKANGGLLLALDTASGLTKDSTEQVTYRNVGDKIREICRRYGWGYRFRLDAGLFKFGIYAGTDRRSQVIFSDEFDNIVTTDYVIDHTSMSNVALVAGTGEGALRTKEISGTAEGTARYEVFVDAKNTARAITYAELKAAYPLTSDGGYGSVGRGASGYVYKMSQFDIQIFDSDQLQRMRNKYPGGMEVSNLNGNSYYRVFNTEIASVGSAAPADDDTIELFDIAYLPRLCSQGYDALAGYGPTTAFEGEVEPSTTFAYKTDYFLGDIVTIRNEFGVSVAARIVEIDEINDETGYRLIPKFEYVS